MLERKPFFKFNRGQKKISTQAGLYDYVNTYKYQDAHTANFTALSDSYNKTLLILEHQ